MQDPEITIEYHFMYIKGFRDDVFRVAKVQRISSSPVRIGTVRDVNASALERLVDVFRCGTESRNYRDFREVKKDPEVFGPLDAETEWTAYKDEICRVKGIQRLDLFQLRTPAWTKGLPASRFRVKYRWAIMNDNPYMVASVGSIMASPAAIWLTDPHVRESALARLYDVFRIGTQGQIYKDLLNCGVEAGRPPEKIRADWGACERTVLREIENGKMPGRAPQEVKAEWDICEKAVVRARKKALELARRLTNDREQTQWGTAPMRFIVVGRNEIERGIVVRTPYVVISIVDPKSRPARLRRSTGFRDEISLRFHDAEPSGDLPLPSEVVLMTQDQAKAIWDFVLRYRDRVGTIVVHCEQGMSRSPAVAAAICKALGGEEEPFFREYAPNQYVYELLLATAPNLGGKTGIPPGDSEV